MTQATDWENVANGARSGMSSFAELSSYLEELRHFYDKNLTDAYWTGLAGGDLIGTSGITKDQFVSIMTLQGNIENFLDNVAVSAADRRATVEQTRNTV